MANQKPRLLLVDGNNMLFRAYSGIKFDMRNSSGFPTKGIYGFFSSLHRIMEELQPTKVVVVFDGQGAKAKKQATMDKLYKADRKGMPDDLAIQLPVVKQILSLMGHAVYHIDEYEADDVIATLSQKYKRNYRVVIGSNDKDFTRLICSDINQLNLGDGKLYTPKAIEAKYGIMPSQFRLYHALLGDGGDGVPPAVAPRIGPKTVLGWIHEHKDFDSIYAAYSSKIRRNRFRLNLKLVGLNTKLPISPQKPVAKIPQLITLLDEYELKSIKQRLSPKRLF